MPIEAVSGPKFFTSHAYTDNGNEYRRSNYGKIAGTAIGAGAGTYFAVKGAKVYKEVLPLVEKSGIFEALPEIINSFGSSLDESFKLTETEIKEAPEVFLKYGKRAFKGAVAGLSAAAVLLGLATGGIGDGIANIVRRRNADKAATQDKSAKV